MANALQQLQGEFFLRTGQRDKGRATLEDVAKKARAAPGPDAWTQALFTLESIARAAREVGDWDFAAWAAGQMQEHDPNYGGTQYALGPRRAAPGRPQRGTRGVRDGGAAVGRTRTRT